VKFFPEISGTNNLNAGSEINQLHQRARPSVAWEKRLLYKFEEYRNFCKGYSSVKNYDFASVSFKVRANFAYITFELHPKHFWQNNWIFLFSGNDEEKHEKRKADAPPALQASLLFYKIKSSLHPSGQHFQRVLPKKALSPERFPVWTVSSLPTLTDKFGPNIIRQVT